MTGHSVAGFWGTADRFWNTSRGLAWLLSLCGISVAIWTAFRPQSPGIAIGLLALAAGIMSVRPQMHTAEKFAWVAVLIALAVLEVKAIGRADQQANTERNHQNEEFQHMADGLTQSLKLSEREYASTIAHVDTAASRAQAATETANRAVVNITGGDSYAYVYPDYIDGQDPRVPVNLKIHNAGKYMLTGLQIKIGKVERGSYDPLTVLSTGIDQLVMVNYRFVYVGTIAPQEGEIIPNYGFVPDLNADGTAYYHMYINAQNRGVQEELYLRRSRNGRSLAYMFTVHTFADGAHRTTDVLIKGRWMRYLKQTDWTEPIHVDF